MTAHPVALAYADRHEDLAGREQRLAVPIDNATRVTEARTGTYFQVQRLDRAGLWHIVARSVSRRGVTWHVRTLCGRLTPEAQAALNSLPWLPPRLCISPFDPCTAPATWVASGGRR